LAKKILFYLRIRHGRTSDKVADAISDAILDACLAQDPLSRVACETLLTCNWVVVAGEITTKANVNWPQIIRNTIRQIGYVDAKAGLDADTAGVSVAINRSLLISPWA